MIRFGLAIAALAIACGPALAQDSAGRFTMSPTPEGFLKLDSRNGVVSECRKQGDGYQCRLVPDEREALQGEVDRLTRENADLRDRLAKAGQAVPSGPQAAPKDAPKVPSDEEMDRALGMMEKFIRRFMAIIREQGGPGDKPI
jgi:hypothetical protein